MWLEGATDIRLSLSGHFFRLLRPFQIYRAPPPLHSPVSMLPSRYEFHFHLFIRSLIAWDSGNPLILAVSPLHAVKQLASRVLPNFN